MGVYSYSEWDGRHDFPDLDKDSLLVGLERNLTTFGDLATALWKIQREGIEDDEGRHIAGNRELYRELEQRKQELTSRYDFSFTARALRHQMKKSLIVFPPQVFPELQFIGHYTLFYRYDCETHP